ncbi:MAG: aldo/keto reductase [Gammaproteobacteria bacterium]|nr:aldo/keto reductase [Gammaproteobacteria bacterium]
MQYKKLGNSGLFVSELCLGTMTFGGGDDMWGMIGQLEQREADELLKTAVEADINFIDTANIYAQGRSEAILGRAIRNLGINRHDLVLATKVFGPMGEGPNNQGASRGHISHEIRQSLTRLGTDYIDLYQIHGFDRATPIEETMETLNDLVHQGLVRYIGLSNWAAWQVVKAVGIIESRRLTPLVSLQAYYTLAGRDLEREVVPMLLSEHIGLMVWSPLAGGFLSGKYDREGTSTSDDGRRANFDFPPVNKERAYDVIETMREIAEVKQVSIAQIALAWLLHQPVVSSVIIGAKRVDQLQDNIASTQVKLSTEELSRLQAVSALPEEYPGWMLERQGAYRS